LINFGVVLVWWCFGHDVELRGRLVVSSTSFGRHGDNWAIRSMVKCWETQNVALVEIFGRLRSLTHALNIWPWPWYDIVAVKCVQELARRCWVIGKVLWGTERERKRASTVIVRHGRQKESVVRMVRWAHCAKCMADRKETYEHGRVIIGYWFGMVWEEWTPAGFIY
jgi:hypothetical protein